MDDNPIDAPVPSYPPTRDSEIARLELAKMSIESGTTLDEIIKRSCELSAEVLKVERVGVWMFDDERSSLTCIQLLEAEKKRWSHGAVLYVSEFPDYFRTLSNRKIVPSETALSDPKTSELAEAYLLPLGITSILDAPIFLRGEMIGVLCNEHIGSPREWSTEERDFSASVADILAMKIRAAEVSQLKERLSSQESRLMSMEKSEALAKMALGVAHDFRNLLTAIKNFAHILTHSPELPTSLVQPVRLIDETVERGNQLVAGLVTYGREEPAKPSALNIRSQIENFLPVLHSAVGSQFHLRIDLQETPGRVLMDKNQFERVLLNLVLNARDASPEGGSIEIRTLDDHRQNSVAIEVRDFGEGMDDETKSRIFEPFFSKKENGSGMGMAIVQKIVERVGGIIRVDSAVDRGTTIRIHLPRVSSGE